MQKCDIQFDLVAAELAHDELQLQQREEVRRPGRHPRQGGCLLHALHRRWMAGSRANTALPASHPALIDDTPLLSCASYNTDLSF